MKVCLTHDRIKDIFRTEHKNNFNIIKKIVSAIFEGRSEFRDIDKSRHDIILISCHLILWIIRHKMSLIIPRLRDIKLKRPQVPFSFNTAKFI